MKLREFGLRLWGRGESGARMRLSSITREELLQLGLNQQKAEVLRDFYQRKAVQGLGLPASPIRAQLMEKCIALLGS